MSLSDHDIDAYIGANAGRMGIERNKDHITPILQQHLDMILNTASSKFRIDPTLFGKRLRGISLRDDFGQSAQVIPVEDDIVDIQLDFGLILYLTKMSKVFSGLASVDRKTPSDRNRAFKKVGLALAEAFVLNVIWCEESVWTKELTREELDILGTLLYFSEQFVVAHELSHVAHGLVKEQANVKSIYESFAEESRAMLNGSFMEFTKYVPLSQEQLIENWAEEFLADFMGARLMISSYETCKDKVQAVMMGIDFFFESLKLIQLYHMHTRDKVYFPLTHPPIELRHVKLVNSLKSFTANYDLRLKNVTDFIIDRNFLQMLYRKKKVYSYYMQNSISYDKNMRKKGLVFNRKHIY